MNEYKEFLKHLGINPMLMVADMRSRLPASEKCVFEMYKNCREKCRTDRTFEKYTTEKAFNMKLGRKLKIKGDIDGK